MTKKNPNKQQCSAVSRNGHPCRAWAIHSSQPPLCSAHAGRSIGAGAPPKNQNARTHGYYAKTADLERILDDLEAKGYDSLSLDRELLVARTLYLEMFMHFMRRDLPLKERAAAGNHAINLGYTILKMVRYMDTDEYKDRHAFDNITIDTYEDYEN